MKIGLGNYYIDKYGLEDGAKKMAAHGYECIDFNFENTDTVYYSSREEDFLEQMYTIKKALKKRGVSVHQIHGPHRTPAKDSAEDDRAEWFGKMTKAMVMAKHLGARYMAVRPLMPFGENAPDNPCEVYEINRKYYEALARVGSGLGVVVCLENTPFPLFPLSRSADILKLVKEVNSPYLKVCFDTGHANITGEPLGDAVRTLGEYLKIIHVHDNDGETNSHLPPYEGCIDWADFAEGLYDIAFDGVFTINSSPEDYPGEFKENCEDELARVAKLIAG